MEDIKETKDLIKELTENDIALFDNITETPADEFRFDGYMVILCLEGTATCRVDDKVFSIARNDLFLSYPSLFVKNAMTSIDFRCIVFYMSTSYFESIFLVGSPYGTLWDVKQVLLHNPCMHLSQDEADGMVESHKLLMSKMQRKEMPHYKEVVKLMLQSMIYEFADFMDIKLKDLPKLQFSSAVNLFKRFLQLVQQYTPNHRDVRFYAGLLCITPKYLSAVCKNNSGQTASEIINLNARESIRKMLGNSEKTIKEIAVAAGFENLSFFGKYVKRELGVSPREYRKALQHPLEAIM